MDAFSPFPRRRAAALRRAAKRSPSPPADAPILVHAKAWVQLAGRPSPAGGNRASNAPDFRARESADGPTMASTQAVRPLAPFILLHP